MMMKFVMQEPKWGESFLRMLNTWIANNEIAGYWTPILADVFVFTYPIYLVALYLYGINKKKDYYKEVSLLLFFAGFGSIFVNLLVQSAVEKSRPDVVLNLLFESRDALLMDQLPKNTFPSDHLAMASAIATLTLLWGIKNKDKTFVWLSVPLLFFVVIMGFGRIAIGVHWPTDIIAGICVGVLFAFLLMEKHVLKFIRSKLLKPIINLQEWIWDKVFG